MADKNQTKQEAPQATELYMVPEYGVSVEAVDAKQAATLANNQQKGSAQDAE